MFSPRAAGAKGILHAVNTSYIVFYSLKIQMHNAQVPGSCSVEYTHENTEVSLMSGALEGTPTSVLGSRPGTGRLGAVCCVGCGGNRILDSGVAFPQSCLAV